MFWPQQRWLTSPPTLSLECDEAGFLPAADFVILAFEHDAPTKDVDRKRSRGLSSGRRLMASDTRPRTAQKKTPEMKRASCALPGSRRKPRSAKPPSLEPSARQQP